MSKIFEALSKDDGLAGAAAPQLALAAGAADPIQAPPMPAVPAGNGHAAAPALIKPKHNSEHIPHDHIRTILLQVPPGSPVLPFDYANWGAGEQYRIIRTKIVQDARRMRMIVISSGGSGDGKSLTAINITGALSLKTETALLIDGDFRRASIHKQLNISRTPGLGDVLEGRAKLEDAIVRIEQLPRMYVLPAGEIQANPAELLDGKQWHILREQVRGHFDYIVIDSPPIGTVADYDLIEAGCDGVLFVARPDHSNRNACFKALNHIPKEKLIGTAVNCVKPWFLLRKSSYGSYQQYEYKSEAGAQGA
jgi:capsular exopolysaccharide synthesis family protein